MRKRVFAIVIIWILLMAWWSRYYQTYVNSPIPGGWGVNIDWTRHAIAQEGRIISETDASSVLSSYRGSQSYDWAAITLGITSVIIGGSLDGTLRTLNAIPVVGFVIFPSLVFLLYRRFIGDIELLSSSGVLMLSLSLFPSVRIVFKTALGWYPEPYSTALVLLTLLMVPRAQHSWKHYLVFIILTIVTLNTYHTWVFFFLLISVTVMIFEFFFRRTTEHQGRPLLGLLAAVWLSVLFYLTGTTVSGRFDELINTISSVILLRGLNEFFAAASSELIGASASQALENVGIRRVLSITNYSATFSVVALYGFIRIYRIVRGDGSPLEDASERLILFSLLAFPVIVALFYAMGGLGTAVGRTQYIGIYFAMFCVIALLAKEHGTLRTITMGLAVIMVITTVGGVALHKSTYTAPHTQQEAAAIEFTGQEVPNPDPIFSDTRLGMPLLYYQQDAVISIQVTHEGWEERAEAIFYGESNLTTEEALSTSVKMGVFAKDDSDRVFVLLSERMAESGPSLLSYQLPPAPSVIERFEQNAEFNKVYANGDSILMRRN